jgi:hypothetical protein
MSHQNPDDQPRSTAAQSEDTKTPVVSAPGENGVGKTPPSKPLTPEEQMALYEKDLKENDWGHQPC